MKLTFAQYQDRVSRRCDNVTNSGKTLAGQFVNQIIEELAEEHDWTCLKIRGTAITLVAGTYEYDLPSNFHYVSKVFYKDTDGRPRTLNPSTDDTWFANINEEDPGHIVFYRFISQDDTNQRPKIQVGPPPDATFISQYGSSLHLEQYRTVTELTNDEDYPIFPPEFSRVIEWGASYLMALDQGDTVKAPLFFQKYKEELDKMIRNDKNRFRHQYNIPVAPWASIYPHRTGTRLGLQSDYGD